MPGPVPSHSDELARPRERKGGGQQAITKGTARPATIPDADPDWHPIARRLWDSLAESGQSDFYQSSDWAIAFSLCDDLSHYKKPLINREGEEYHKRSGQMLQTIMTSLSNLLVTEADRRRVRIELDEPPKEQDTPAHVVLMDEYRRDLGVS